jgi:hypothetical protein
MEHSRRPRVEYLGSHQGRTRWLMELLSEGPLQFYSNHVPGAQAPGLIVRDVVDSDMLRSELFRTVIGCRA